MNAELERLKRAIRAADEVGGYQRWPIRISDLRTLIAAARNHAWAIGLADELRRRENTAKETTCSGTWQNER